MDPVLVSTRNPSPSQNNRHGQQRHRPSSGEQDVQGALEMAAGRSFRNATSDGDALGVVPRSNIGRSTSLQYVTERVNMGESSRQQTASDNLSDYSGRTNLAGARERAELIMADRIRRMSRHGEFYPRRRTVSNFPLGHQPREGRRPRATSANQNDENLLVSHSSPPFHTRPQTDLNRPLPRTPDELSPRVRHSREIALPKWQSDTEVASCPICHTTFSFWYRKHHCRKCGRVVCANCSPHRITIPRQFIVHPPEENLSSPTIDNHNNLSMNLHTNEEERGLNDRRESFEQGIDPALGGGQEVRLCNPCVPDPNPTPYPSHLSSGLPFGVQISGVGPGPTGMSRSSNSTYDGHLENQMPPFFHRNLRPQHRFRPGSGSEYYTNHRPSPSAGTPEDSPLLPRSQSHNLHSSSGIAMPSNSPAMYGSAPDRSHEVS